MLSGEFFAGWYAAFAGSVDGRIMRKHVLEPGNMPWHIFSWGGVPCIKGKRAVDEFFAFDGNQKVLIFQGFDYENEQVEEAEFIDKPGLKSLMKYGREVFVTAADFGWTFVWTHESDCSSETYRGPFLCRSGKEM